MDPSPPTPTADLAAKITRLSQERGWNQEDLARIANINRHTVRHIFKHGDARRLRNATVMACARALGLTVNELQSLPIERLLPRMHGQPPEEGEDKLNRLYELGKQPELMAWVQRHPDRVRRLAAGEIDELLRMQGENGPLAKVGVEHFVDLFERKRRLRELVEVVAATELLPQLEFLVDLMAERVRPK